MPRTERHPSPRTVAAAAALVLVAGAVGGLSACSSSATGNFSGSVTTTQPPTAGNFSGSGPSALESLASAGQGAASSAAASVQAQASAFASSVAAESARTKAAYQAALQPVSGRGNAVGEVFLTGLPKAQTGGLHAAVVNITNHSGATSSYAVQVDWTDTSGHVVDSDVVGTEHLAPGAKATPVAFTTKDADLTLVPVVAKAQRF
ncbi:hypothetical protein DN069_10260 [Streptacidiphilus pinicola]|uniref:Lipoprotein n=1 Tax=Streptacidiphilus pinicola TaxID=2219663 RepID=A0A2X0IL82_9ACTN|nr:hypothetical protein [Streptacidiphilus pinicola]RAG85872.1 hypothetical protein DN069_10260 [Streptacidiphilus pinicola]